MPMRGNGRLPISWPSLVSTLGLALALVGGFWGITQTQFSSMYGLIQENKASQERILQAVRADSLRNDTELKAELQFLRQQFISRRPEFVGQPEFHQFQKAITDRLERIDKQLQSIESTRPTTGELQNTARALDSQVNRVEERVRVIEQYIRGVPPPRN